MKVRAHVWVYGKVQGVFFRYNTKLVAQQHDVKGWVRNLPDGSVEAIFEGEEGNVKKVIEWCRKGPPGAKVIEVQVRWEDYKGEYKEFEIIY